MSKFEDALKNADAALRKLGMEDLITGGEFREEYQGEKVEDELFTEIQKCIKLGHPDFPEDVLVRHGLATTVALMTQLFGRGQRWHTVNPPLDSSE